MIAWLGGCMSAWVFAHKAVYMDQRLGACTHVWQAHQPAGVERKRCGVAADMTWTACLRTAYAEACMLACIKLI